MIFQALVVAVIVVACALYAGWTLMPASLRRRAAAALLARRLPEPLAARLRPHALASSGCGCHGCDHAPAKVNGAANKPVNGTATSAAGRARPVPEAQPLRFYPRPPR